MLDTSHGGVSMVVCSGSVHQSVIAEAQADAAVGHDTKQNHHDQNHHGDSICPFAVAVTGASAPAVLPMLLGAVSVVDAVAISVAEYHSSFGPSRAQQPRAPPFFV